MAQDRLRPSPWLAILGSLGTGTALLVACGGTVSNGNVGSTSQSVSAGSVSGPVTPCNSGEAHPNVCCEAGPGQATACVVYPDAPFTACASGSTTYPDPRSCCPIDGSGGCASPPPPPPDDAGAGSGGNCGYTCPVGWYSPPPQTGTGTPNGGPTGTGSGSGGSSGGGCCQVDSSGAETCAGSSSTGPSCACACPACDSEGGPCPPCLCDCPPPQPPSCDPCPPGWQAPAGEPLLCCETAPDGAISCFSQGVPPPGSPTPTPTPPSSGGCFASGGGAPGGVDASTTTQCGCSETVNGTSYSVTCTDPGGTCTCSEGSSGPGGGTVGTTIKEPSTACNDMGALFSACGFPAVGASGGSAGANGGGGG